MAPPSDWTPQQIADLRERLGITQAQMAKALGYSKARTISDLEYGRRKPNGSVRVLLDLLDEGTIKPPGKGE